MTRRRIPWWGVVILAAWLVPTLYLAVFNAAMYMDGYEHQKGMVEWVGRYSREHGVTMVALRAVKDPIGGYLRTGNTVEQNDYYQAAMYAQSVAEWRPIRTGLEMFATWALQCLLVPGIILAGWRWFRWKKERVPVGPKP